MRCYPLNYGLAAYIPDNDFIMQGKYKVVTLCGSTRFKDDF